MLIEPSKKKSKVKAKVKKLPVKSDIEKTSICKIYIVLDRPHRVLFLKKANDDSFDLVEREEDGDCFPGAHVDRFITSGEVSLSDPRNLLHLSILKFFKWLKLDQDVNIFDFGIKKYEHTLVEYYQTKYGTIEMEQAIYTLDDKPIVQAIRDKLAANELSYLRSKGLKI